jgi:hypothetical protein
VCSHGADKNVGAHSSTLSQDFFDLRCDDTYSCHFSDRRPFWTFIHTILDCALNASRSCILPVLIRIVKGRGLLDCVPVWVMVYVMPFSGEIQKLCGRCHALDDLFSRAHDAARFRLASCDLYVFSIFRIIVAHAARP